MAEEKKRKAPNKIVTRLLISCIVALVVPLTAYLTSFAWFNSPGGQSQVIDGIVGVRNYFHAGNGKPGSPFEITEPRHLYNLSRLQSLGIFSKQQFEFQIGTKVNYGTTQEPIYRYQCISGYDSNGNPIYSNHLDMSGFDRIIEPIGNESAPFIGHIDGNNIPIKDLSISGSPDDIGLFGYISHEGVVEKLILDNLTITSLGYNNNPGDDDNILFSEIVDPLFEEGAKNFRTANLKFVDERASSAGEILLRSKAAVEKEEINKGMTGVLPDYVFNGYFELIEPPTWLDSNGDVADDPFTYSLRSSTPLMFMDEDKHVAHIDLERLAENDEFNGTTAHKPATSRISIIASTNVGGIDYSRVIQSYTCRFETEDPNQDWTVGTNDWDQGEVKLTITCDYIETVGAVPYETYHHGNNVGLLAGHVDGTMKDCYIYNGTLKLNDSGYHPIPAESATGLIGEIGSDVESALNPEEASSKGERGIMNVSGIYSMIRDDFVSGEKTRAGKERDTSDAKKIISYKRKLKSTADLYKKYLRHDDFEMASGGYGYITSAGNLDLTSVYSANENYTIPNNYNKAINSVDFKWNQVIEEGKAIINGEEVERGLGVFKIVSHYQGTTEPYGSYMTSGLGNSTIYNGSNEIKDIFFSTAEIDWDKQGNTNPWNDGVTPLRMNTLPPYSDLGTFKYPYSRDFNYCFHLDLNDAANTNANKQYYMYNNNSAFLSNYLNTVLINSKGAPVRRYSGSTLNAKFGFYLRKGDAETLDFLRSYISVSKPSDKQVYYLESGVRKYFPPNSIVFHIDNVNGANVSVIGNNTDISIYSFDSTIQTGTVKEIYTMRSRNLGKDNMHRYFEYNRSTGEVARTVTPISNMKDTDALYAHIFKLTEPGDYVIGASNKLNSGSAYAHIYYLAVQGQNEGEDEETTTYISGSGITNVDFLLEPPMTEEQYATSTSYVDVDSLHKANFSFQAYFDESEGTGTLSAQAFIDKNGTEEDTSDDRICMKVSFNDSAAFTRYLLAVCNDEDPYFWLESGETPKKFPSRTGKYPFES